MSSLEEQINGLRCKNFESRFYVPERSLYSLMTRDVIQTTLQGCGLAPYHVDETVETITKGGRKIFAILVLLGKAHLISKFIEHDQFQSSQLDHKLPFSEAALDSIIGKTKFFETQWEFAVPVFSERSLHRSLHPDTILPFVKDEEVSEGGFGVVTEVTLHASHQKLPLPCSGENLRIVRKEFKQTSSVHGDFNNEQRNLAILNHIKHPNIIQLLSSYTYRRKHHFLFPLASGGDLAEFLASKDRPVAFDLDETFYLALCGLASAIENVHDYTSHTLDLELIGCHHDLNPKNVLIDGNKFILADFGLSSFKSTKEKSKTVFKLGKGYYLAPECEDFEDGFKKLTISRPSDMWSFGCMIMDVVTYMILGAGGVKEFRKSRGLKVTPEYKTSLFHAGKTENPGVEAWFTKLETLGTSTDKMVVQEVRKILNLCPAARPKAKQVAARLRFLAVHSVYKERITKYMAVSEACGGLEASLELLRFKAWGWSVGLIELDGDHTPASDVFSSEMLYGTIIWHLTAIKEELEMVVLHDNNPSYPRFVQLHLINDQLVNILPSELQGRIKGLLELQMVNTDDLELLKKTGDAFRESPSHRRIGMFATIKRMYALASEQSKLRRPDLRINSKLVQETEVFGTHQLAWVTSTHMSSKRRVLIDWILYETHWEGPVAQELFIRVEAIAELLNSNDKPVEFRVLHCSGFYHEPTRHAFGLIYDFPSLNDEPASESIKPLTLADVLEDRRPRGERPLLEHRIELARDVANTVLAFHKVRWLHKNLSAYNVVFFNPPSTTLADSIKSPYLIGFSHSRPHDPQAFTEGAVQDPRLFDYQHPRYIRAKRGFRPEFDYYSLGLILLEIGMWASLQTLNSGKEMRCLSPEQLLEAHLAKWVPALGHTMGAGYRDAVEACLRGHFGQDDMNATAGEKCASMSLCIRFEKLVVQRIGISA